MKTLIATVALVALAASPALARTYHTQAAPSDYSAGYDANDYANSAPNGLVGNSPAVIFDNKVVGQDPDPNVRMMIEKDPGLLAQ